MRDKTRRIKLIQYLAFMLYLAMLPPALQASQCPARVLKAINLYEGESCQCGKSVRNIVATLPPGLKLIAACGLSDGPYGDSKKIDLDKTRITLDQFTNGSLPYGKLLIQGNLTIRGVLRVEEGPAGTYWLKPARPVLLKDTPLSSAFRVIGFFDESGFKRLRIPRHLQDQQCIEVDVLMKLHNMDWIGSDGDESGVHPVQYELLKTRHYRVCNPG